MCMVIGLGTDLIEIERIEHSVARFGQRFLERVFTPGEIAYCPAKDIPFAQKVEHCRFELGGFTSLHTSETPDGLVNLIARPKKKLGLVEGEVSREVDMGKSVVPDACEQSDHDFFFCHRVRTNDAGIVIFRVDNAVLPGVRCIPIGDPKSCIPRVGIDFGRRHRLPGTVWLLHL